MDILIFSDSHGRGERMQEVLSRQIRCPDAILFAGDGLRDLSALWYDERNIFSVAGNCDWFAVDEETERLLSFGGHKLLLTHGHLYGVKGGYGSLLSHAVRVGAELVVFGHTHCPYLETVPAGEVIGRETLTHPIHLFNPGSIGYEGSFGTLTIRGKDVLFSHGQV